MLFDLLERAGAYVLQYDPASQRRLEELEGSVIALEILHLNQTLFLCPGTDGVRVSLTCDGDPDVTLRAAPSTFAKIAAQGLEDAEYQPGEVEIEGDAVLAQRFARAMSAIEVDWEELLAETAGDIPARFIGRTLRELKAWAEESRDTFKQNLGEYLVEEARVAAHPEDVNQFIEDVDRLRGDVERFAARLAQLAARTENKG